MVDGMTEKPRILLSEFAKNCREFIERRTQRRSHAEGETVGNRATAAISENRKRRPEASTTP